MHSINIQYNTSFYCIVAYWVHSLVDTANVRICEVVIKKHELNCFWSTLIGISQILLCVVIHLCHCYPELFWHRSDLPSRPRDRLARRGWRGEVVWGGKNIGKRLLLNGVTGEIQAMFDKISAEATCLL